jgi:cell division protein FtsB
LRRQNIIRALLFVVFFSIGATALSGSILCADLLQYYRNREQLEAEKDLSNQLKSLNADYDALLEQLKKDPNLIKRIAPATLGMDRNEADTIYPKATAEQLAAARKALTEEMGRNTTEATLPEWLIRCGEPAQRTMLFFAGAGLILISFICFGPAKEKNQKEAKS